MKGLKILMTMVVCSGFLLPVSGFNGLFLHNSRNDGNPQAEQRAPERQGMGNYMRIRTSIEANSNTSNNKTGNANVATGTSSAHVSLKTSVNDGTTEEQYDIEASPQGNSSVSINKESGMKGDALRPRPRNNNKGIFSPMFSELLRLFGRH